MKWLVKEDNSEIQYLIEFIWEAIIVFMLKILFNKKVSNAGRTNTNQFQD